MSEEIVFGQTTNIAIDEAMDAIEKQQRPRPHLGMSQIGNPDSRTLWLQFRWCLQGVDTPAPRTQRIFAMGHIIEEEIFRLLRDANIEIHDRDPESPTGQFNFSYVGGHFGGSMDAAGLGFPEAPTKWHVVECKSANDSNFKQFIKEGVKKKSPTYYGQCQCYMAATGMDRAVIIIYNKNTSEIYCERIHPEKFYWEGALTRATDIIEAASPPDTSFPNRDWYEIKKFKSEEYQRVYWGEQLPQGSNCRNCRFSLPETEDDQNMNGLDIKRGPTWSCWKKGIPSIGISIQEKGCEAHNWIPQLVNAELIHLTDETATYQTQQGATFTNAPDSNDHRQPGNYTSAELTELSKVDFDPEWVNDPINAALREEMPGSRIEHISPSAADVLPMKKAWEK